MTGCVPLLATQKANRELSCWACQTTLVLPPVIPDSSTISSVLQMQLKLSEMS